MMDVMLSQFEIVDRIANAHCVLGHLQDLVRPGRHPGGYCALLEARQHLG